MRSVQWRVVADCMPCSTCGHKHRDVVAWHAILFAAERHTAHLKAALPWNCRTERSSASTEPLSKGAYGTRHRRTVQSVLQDTAASPLRVTDTPLTAPVWPAQETSAFQGSAVEAPAAVRLTRNSSCSLAPAGAGTVNASVVHATCALCRSRSCRSSFVAL